VTQKQAVNRERNSASRDVDKISCRRFWFGTPSTVVVVADVGALPTRTHLSEIADGLRRIQREDLSVHPPCAAPSTAPASKPSQCDATVTLRKTRLPLLDARIGSVNVPSLPSAPPREPDPSLDPDITAAQPQPAAAARRWCGFSMPERDSENHNAEEARRITLESQV
jgi:hypothetical protein